MRAETTAAAAAELLLVAAVDERRPVRQAASRPHIGDDAAKTGAYRALIELLEQLPSQDGEVVSTPAEG